MLELKYTYFKHPARPNRGDSGKYISLSERHITIISSYRYLVDFERTAGAREA
jgi:hypothetical protein